MILTLTLIHYNANYQAFIIDEQHLQLRYRRAFKAHAPFAICYRLKFDTPTLLIFELQTRRVTLRHYAIIS